MKLIKLRTAAIAVSIIAASLTTACEWEYKDKDTNKYGINQWSPLATGTPVRLQCTSSSGSWVTAHTSKVLEPNANVNFPDRPVRRVNFADYKGKMLARGCGFTTTSSTGWQWHPIDPCIQQITITTAVKTLWRLQHGNDNNLVLWNSAEKKCFSDSSQPDLWDRFLECNENSPNERNTQIGGTWNTRYRLVPKYSKGSNGKICI